MNKMAGYIKELLLDAALNRLSVEVQSDLTIAIEQTYQSGMYSIQEMHYLDMYLQGYTSHEIAQQYSMTTEKVDIVLERIFQTIEELSGYTDDTLTKRIERNIHYRRSGIRELQSFLAIHGKRFMTHGVEA